MTSPEPKSDHDHLDFEEEDFLDLLEDFLEDFLEGFLEGFLEDFWALDDFSEP